MKDVGQFEIQTLPDIEIYGGDNIPWEVTLIRDNGTYYSVETASECTATLTLTPLKATTGLGNNSNTIDPIFTKSGSVLPKLNGSAVVMFYFSRNDTKDLRGKFVYQIEVRHNNDLRICQGHLYIKQNINR